MRSISKLTPILGIFALAALAAPNQAVAQEGEVVKNEVSDEKSKAERERVKVTVVNRNFADMRVYAVNGAQSWRLGTVTGLTDETFTLPRFLSFGADQVRLVLNPIGGRGFFSSHELIVTPGDEVVFYVENAIGLSNAVVR